MVKLRPNLRPLLEIGITLKFIRNYVILKKKDYIFKD